MARWAWLVSFIALGCNGNDTPQPKYARPIDDGPAAASAAVHPKPDKSDPAAELRLSQVVLAHTANEPRRLEAFKVHTQKRDGECRFGDKTSPAKMGVQAAWPDRYRTNFVTAFNGNAAHVIAVRGGGGWQVAPGAAAGAPAALTPSELESVLPDVRAEWLVALVPLNEPTTRCAPVTGPAPSGVDALRVWVGDDPPAVLHVDRKTSLLKKVVYEAHEQGQVIARSLTLSEHKPAGGVLMPQRVEFSSGLAATMTWRSVEYGLPATVDAAAFERP